MASTNQASRKYFARDLVAYTDAELDSYLEEHRLEGGASAIDLEDPENLPDSFIQRLRIRCAGNTSQSTPVNLDQVTSRLLEISSGRNTSPQPLSYNRPSSVETEPPTPTEDGEIKDYNELVTKGGRPLYPIHLIDEVAKDPVTHWDMLRPWLDYPPDFEPDPDPDSYIDWRVFKAQLGSWDRFRRWQSHNRREGRPRYVGIDYLFGPTDSAFNIFVWEFRRASPTYTEAVRSLLAQYGFTHPFQFHEDPTQQDKLTTWIEYLGYECSIHYRYNSMVKRMQLVYDEAWKALVNSNVLREFETEEDINNIKCAIRHQIEEDQALAAVKSAESAFAAALRSHQEDITKPHGSQVSPATHTLRMTTAKSRLDAAMESLESIERRNNLVTEFSRATRKYRIAKDDAVRYYMRVRWIMEQVPLIEAELNDSGMGETNPEIVRGTKRPIRDEDEEDTHERSTKKHRRDSGVLGSTSVLQFISSYENKRAKRSRQAIAADKRPTKRIREGGPVPKSHFEVLNSTIAELVEDSQETARLCSDEPAVVKTVGEPSPGANKAKECEREKSTSYMAQSSASSTPLRRSARNVLPTPVPSTGTNLSHSNTPTPPAAAKRRTVSNAKSAASRCSHTEGASRSSGRIQKTNNVKGLRRSSRIRQQAQRAAAGAHAPKTQSKSADPRRTRDR